MPGVAAPFALAAGPFSQDGKQGLAVSNLASNDISVLAGVGNGTFQPTVSYATSSGTSLVLGENKSHMWSKLVTEFA